MKSSFGLVFGLDFFIVGDVVPKEGKEEGGRQAGGEVFPGGHWREGARVGVLGGGKGGQATTAATGRVGLLLLLAAPSHRNFVSRKNWTAPRGSLDSTDSGGRCQPKQHCRQASVPGHFWNRCSRDSASSPQRGHVELLPWILARYSPRSRE